MIFSYKKTSEVFLRKFRNLFFIFIDPKDTSFT